MSLTILNRLYLDSYDKRSMWTKTADEDAFRLTLNSGMLRVEKHTKEHRKLFLYKTEESYYTLIVFDKLNNELMRFHSYSDPASQQAIEGMWTLAKINSASGTKAEKIEAILRELKS